MNKFGRKVVLFGVCMVAITIAYKIAKLTKFRSVQQNITNEIEGSGKTVNELTTTKEPTTSFYKKELLLFVAIISAPYHEDRRTAGRETWIKECSKRSDVVCKYFTDGRDSLGKVTHGKERMKLENEIKTYGDLVLNQAPGGVNFGLQLLWILDWVNNHYSFKYFLRIDDDYFICLNKLMHELASGQRPKKSFQWGWLHCELKDATWLDESFFLVTFDIIQSFLRRKKNLMCNPWEGQSIGFWLKKITNLTTFSDNARLVHMRSHSRKFGPDKVVKLRKEICHSLLGLHQSYPDQMRLYWKIYDKEDKVKPYVIPPTSYHCKYQVNVNYLAWRPNSKWFAPPRPCRDNPTWSTKQKYVGRQQT